MLPQLPADKANHALYGAAVFVACYAALRSVPQALAMVVLVGVAKELSDALINRRATGNWRQGPHGVEALDAVATWLGGVLCALPLCL